MATSKTVTDKFSNFAALMVTMAAANTLKTEKFNFPYSVADRIAIIINRIEYYPGALGQLDTTTDYALFGLLASSSIVDPLNQADPILVDSMSLTRYDQGAAAASTYHQLPLVKDLSALPGGGLIVAPAPLYAFMTSGGAGAAMSCRFKLFYTYVELVAEEFWQLVESRRIISNT